MSNERPSVIIAVIGKAGSGKSAFINAAVGGSVAEVGGEGVGSCTQEVFEYTHSLPGGGPDLVFLDTPGFDGYRPNEYVPSRDDILRTLEKAASNLKEKKRAIFSHILVFQSAGDVDPLPKFEGTAKRLLDSICAEPRISVVTTHWDESDDTGGHFDEEEAKDREESLHPDGSFLAYLRNTRGPLSHFRSGQPTDGNETAGWVSPKDLIDKLLGLSIGSVDEQDTLEELKAKLAAVTKERDDITDKYERLLQQSTQNGDASGGFIPTPAPAASDAIHRPRTRAQRLLSSLEDCRARMLETASELEREAADVSAECESNRAEHERAQLERKAAEANYAVLVGEVKGLVDDYRKLRREHDTFKQREGVLAAELNSMSQHSVVRAARRAPGQKRRLQEMLEEAQAGLARTERYLAGTEEDYEELCREVEQAAEEIEKLRRIERGKERVFVEWLEPERAWLVEEGQNLAKRFRGSPGSEDDIKDVRLALEGQWEKQLTMLTDLSSRELDGHPLDPKIVEGDQEWVPVIQPFLEGLIMKDLTEMMVDMQDKTAQRLRRQGDAIDREWKKGAEDIFGESLRFQRTQLPRLEGQAKNPAPRN
ncbi:hypothetical protein DFP72DRAFT_912885 [Ephemerocybe angulata]|uniref:G domain-containing protein n=1 Tax=Ephemerocybe angulata TaxID=980116 RepID=A0A8H6M088_9AGAR|nr:hypothetical protein DFP72DRAFT_912885 [Tulosesus angulatus]